MQIKMVLQFEKVVRRKKIEKQKDVISFVIRKVGNQ